MKNVYIFFAKSIMVGVSALTERLLLSKLFKLPYFVVCLRVFIMFFSFLRGPFTVDLRAIE
jgi:hypothetical protein